MHCLSSACIEEILCLIDSHKSAHEISSITGIGLTTVTCYWSEHFSHVPKPSGSCPKKLTDANLCHATCLICSRKADNAVQITRSLHTITNQSLSPQTIRNYLKQSSWKAVVKKKRPLLIKHHRNAWLDFATQGCQRVRVILSDLWKSLVQIESESDFSLFPRLRVKINKSMIDLWRFSKIPKIKMGADMKVLKRKDPKMVIPKKENFFFGNVSKHL